jgi:hypothetical protein
MTGESAIDGKFTSPTDTTQAPNPSTDGTVGGRLLALGWAAQTQHDYATAARLTRHTAGAHQATASGPICVTPRWAILPPPAVITSLERYTALSPRKRISDRPRRPTVCASADRRDARDYLANKARPKSLDDGQARVRLTANVLHQETSHKRRTLPPAAR